MVKKIVLAAAVIAVTALPHHAGAALIRRSMLIQACTSHNQQQLNNCAGYIVGVADMSDSVAQGVCIPPGIKVGLIRQGVANWLQSHTTNDGPAAPAVVDALRHLYHCGP